MRAGKILKILAKKEGVSVEQLRADMQMAINQADWKKYNPELEKPASVEEAIYRGKNIITSYRNSL